VCSVRFSLGRAKAYSWPWNSMPSGHCQREISTLNNMQRSRVTEYRIVGVLAPDSKTNSEDLSDAIPYLLSLAFSIRPSLRYSSPPVTQRSS
jgi:hypothetical protein